MVDTIIDCLHPAVNWFYHLTLFIGIKFALMTSVFRIMNLKFRITQAAGQAIPFPQSTKSAQIIPAMRLNTAGSPRDSDSICFWALIQA
jgi:hypothetical protein